MSWILDKTFFRNSLHFKYYEVTSKSGTIKKNTTTFIQTAKMTTSAFKHALGSFPVLEFLEISGFPIYSTANLANILKNRPHLAIAHNNQAFINSNLSAKKLSDLHNKYKHLLEGKDIVPL